MDEMKIRESIERDYGKLHGPMTILEFYDMLDSLDAEDEAD